MTIDLNESKIWIVRRTGEVVKIKNMTSSHRRNTAQLLMTKAVEYTGEADTFTAEMLVENSPLYLALIADPADPDWRAVADGREWRSKKGDSVLVASMTRKAALKALAKLDLRRDPSTDAGKALIAALNFQASGGMESANKLVSLLVGYPIPETWTVTVEQTLTPDLLRLKVVAYDIAGETAAEFDASGTSLIELITDALTKKH